MSRGAVVYSTLAITILLAGGTPSPAALVDVGGPAPLPTPKPTARPSPTPTPGGGTRLLDRCTPNRAFVDERLLVPACGAEARVDETWTILANTVLQRTCSPFVVHHDGGNAILDSTAARNAGLGTLPGKSKGQPGWVLMLRGCNLDKISKVEVSGTGVSATIIPPPRILSWLVPPVTEVQSAGSPASPRSESSFIAKGQVAFVQFEPSADAHTPHDRQIKVTFAGAPGTAGSTQQLKKIKLLIAHNGLETSRQPGKVRWEEETDLVFGGDRLASARIAGPACLKQSSLVSSAETKLHLKATFHCPVPVPGEPGVTVNDPTCQCSMLAYDKALDVYPELAKTPFNYLSTPIQVIANLDYLKKKPAVIGDSLSHGAFSGTVTERSQRWAYPHLVVGKMGGTPLTQNIIHTGPNIEDAIKSLLPDRYGPAPHFLDLDPHPIGLLQNGAVTSGAKTTLPTHTGIAGFDYTNVLRTSGQCLDKRGQAKRRYDLGAQDPPQLCPDRCEDDDGNVLPSPSVDAQLGLGCSTLSPIEMLEDPATQPTFVFASAAPNYALSCAVTTTTEGCLEWGRFERDSAEVFKRLRAIPSIKGGVVFGIPPLGSIPYLVPHKPNEPCANGKTRLRPFWKDESVGEDEILDCNERQELDSFIEHVNDRLRELAEQNRYAFVDSIAAFNRLASDGQQILDASGRPLCSAKTSWPTRTLDVGPEGLDHPQNGGNDAGCGLISLDGAHPSQFGQTVMANEQIKAINQTYGLDIPTFSAAELFATWQDDDLSQDPIDMNDFMHLDLGETLGEGVGVAACVAPAAACVLTNGLACLGAAELEGILALTPVRDVCLEPVVRFLITETGFRKVDTEVQPAHCWDGHCPDSGDVTPD